jgi:hypothetical protein
VGFQIWSPRQDDDFKIPVSSLIISGRKKDGNMEMFSKTDNFSNPEIPKPNLKMKK